MWPNLLLAFLLVSKFSYAEFFVHHKSNQTWNAFQSQTTSQIKVSEKQVNVSSSANREAVSELACIILRYASFSIPHDRTHQGQWMYFLSFFWIEAKIVALKFSKIGVTQIQYFITDVAKQRRLRGKCILQCPWQDVAVQLF